MSKTTTIIGNSEAIVELKEKIKQIANAKATILITGESGTGKELVAKMLHSESKRITANFVPINCGAIPTELLESELFGHEKGAFTGAVSARIGRFELANQGTLFLDEISEMPLFMQVKLLRVLQEQVLERLGSTKSVNINVRIIAATNKDLDSLVEDGTFREDLFYRLNVVPLNIVPLRERLEDLPLLIEHFQNQIEDYDGGKVKFTDSAYDAMVNYSWPGNVRELYNIVERVTVLYPKQDITIAQIPQKIKIGGGIAKTSTLSQKIITNPYELGDNFSLKDKICEIESTYIKKALAENNGVVAQAANALGIRRTTLVEKLKKLNIEPKSLREAR
ncbi:MAG: sigma-54-dependent Fis family transcriptional regulator [Francisellaceae bacterium]|nr:sigma-54-dependent Fis family transcriptional regulator [Francisellaceae bacterium]MBT6538071.1 sigma-54-dependent Fis family transcriptional regulator [Francisellaceae bacterium]